MFSNKTLLLAAFSAIFILSSCEKDNNNDDGTPTPKTGSFSIQLDHFFDSQSFQLGQTYMNGSGEELNFTTAKYYLSNVKLANTDGSIWSEEESYRLIDLSDPASLIPQIKNVPPGDYHMVMFTIGVDSARNVAGAQEGALSPANNMFWSWNSGYIFFKFEGNSPQAANNAFTYHIGGFMEPNNAIANHSFHMHMPNLSISPDATPMIHLEVDVKKVFDGTNTFSVANMPSVTMPGMMAKHISENFSEAFTLDHVHL